MIKLPLYYDLEGGLITENGEKVEADFENVEEATAFIEKYKFLYEFRGSMYETNGLNVKGDLYVPMMEELGRR